jgi:hypothetical protein
LSAVRVEGRKEGHSRVLLNDEESARNGSQTLDVHMAVTEHDGKGPQQFESATAFFGSILINLDSEIVRMAISRFVALRRSELRARSGA